MPTLTLICDGTPVTCEQCSALRIKSLEGDLELLFCENLKQVVTFEFGCVRFERAETLRANGNA